MDEKKKVKAKTKVLILAAMIMIAITASAIAPAAASYCLIEGNVTYCNEGTAAIDPTVTVKNMNGGMVFEDVSPSGDNHYLVQIVYAAGDILCFNASKGDNRNIFNYTATQDDVTNKYIEKDINITICGDANCDGFVDVDDITKLERKVGLVVPLDCDWAGDVNCDDLVDVDDITKLERKVGLLNALACCHGCK
jgi:hypothetical protein